MASAVFDLNQPSLHFGVTRRWCWSFCC